MSREALGIAIGDTISTSYNTGPYVVESIWGPYWWWTGIDSKGEEVGYDHLTIWQYPVASFGGKWGGINDVHQDGDRWFTDGGDEIFVVKAKVIPIFQIDMFDVPPEKDDDPRRRPYVYQTGVDYSRTGIAHHCYKCHKDFNGGVSVNGVANPNCIYCGAWVCKDIIVMHKVVPGERYKSELIQALSVERNHESTREDNAESTAPSS